MRVYANISNGLAFPHDDVCHFLSTHGHNYRMGYLRLDSMPYSAAIELLQGRQITVVDATQHDKPLTDGIKYGLTTWAHIFNRAIFFAVDRVAPWDTPEIRKAASRRQWHTLVQGIRRLWHIYGDCGPVRIGPGQAIEVKVYRNFKLDDKPALIGACDGRYGTF